MSVVDLFTSNPWLLALAVPVTILIALGAYKLVREFLPW